MSPPRRFNLIAVVSAVILVSTATSVAQEPLAISPITVVDVIDGSLRPDQTVLIEGERIAAVGNVGRVEVPGGAPVVDGTGKYLIPGLWDMHVHTSSERITREVLYPLFIAHGVTGIRNMIVDCFAEGPSACGPLDSSIDQAKARHRDVEAGVLAGPRVVAGSAAANGAGPDGVSTVQGPGTAEHARAFVRLEYERGVDFIKTYDMLPRDAYFALADEAARLGLPFAGHVPVAVRTSEASDAGQASIEHIGAGNVLDECSAREDELRPRVTAELRSKEPYLLPLVLEMVDSHDAEKCAALFARLIENGTWVTPTLMVERLPSEGGTGWREDPRMRYVPRQERALFASAEAAYDAVKGDAAARARYIRWTRRVTREAQKAGVRLLAGSDSGDPGIFWGSALHEELELLVSAGLTEAEALRAATLGPAEFLEATDSLGTVERGKLADLVLLAGNPLEDITNTQQIEAVVLRGRYVDREALDGLLLRAERAASPQGADTIPVTADTLRYVEVVDGQVLGSWRTWREETDTWGFKDDRRNHFDRTERLELDASGLPIHLEATGSISEGVPWYERFERDGEMVRWFTPRARGEATLAGPAFYKTVYPAIDPGVLARALLRQPSHTLPLLPEGQARLQTLGERVAEAGGRRRVVRLYALHGTDLLPRYVWLDERRATFADEWSVLKGWKAAFPELRSAVDDAIGEHQRALARALVPPPRTRPLVIRDARLFDPATGEVHGGTTIVIEGDRVTAVGSHDSVSEPEDPEVVEAAGQMAIPGLWDVHAHLRNPASQDQVFDWGGELLHLAAGVTSVRDVGSHVRSLVELRTAIQAGDAVGPRIVVAGFLYDTTETDVIETPVATPEEARALVDHYAELGFPQIKLHILADTTLVHAAIARAKEHGMRVTGHLPDGMTSRGAIDAGYDEMMHLWWMVWTIPWTNEESIAAGETYDSWHQVWAGLPPESQPVREFVALLAERGIAVDPTIGLFLSESTPPEFVADVVDRMPAPVARYLRHRPYTARYFPRSPLAREARDQAVSNLLALLPALHDAGVPILPGSDTWPGFGLHYELERYVEAGIPAPDVLSLATLGTAREMGMGRDLGSIEPGKLADLILVDGDPTRVISDIRRVTTVIKGGRVYRPAAIYRALGIEPCCPR